MLLEALGWEVQAAGAGAGSGFGGSFKRSETSKQALWVGPQSRTFGFLRGYSGKVALLKSGCVFWLRNLGSALASDKATVYSKGSGVVTLGS